MAPTETGEYETTKPKLLIQRVWAESKKSGMRTQDRECTLLQSGQGMGLQEEIWGLVEGPKRMPSVIETQYDSGKQKIPPGIWIGILEDAKKNRFSFLKKIYSLTVIYRINSGKKN